MESFIKEFHSSKNPFTQAAISKFRIAILDRQGKIKWANDNFSELTPFSLSQLIEKSMQELIPEDGNAAYQELCNAIRDCLTWDGEVSNIAKDGSARWLKIQLIPVHDPSRNDIYFLTLMANITRVKQVEHERETAIDNALQSEIRYNALSENETDLFGVYDGHGKCIHVNKVYCSFFGTRPEEILGKNFFSHSPADVGHEIVSKIKKLSQDEPHAVICYQMNDANKETRFIVWRFLAFFDKTGFKKEIIAIGRDITEVKAAEDQINTYTEALEKIAFMTAHNVRGPIARALGLIQLFKMNAIHTEEWTQLLNCLKDSVAETDKYTRELGMFIYTKQYNEKLTRT